MDGFDKPDSNLANGGDVTKGIPLDMSTTEYNRLQGSDGFSKGQTEAGLVIKGRNAHQYDEIKKQIV